MRGGGQLGNLQTQHTRQPNRWATYDPNYIDTCEVMQRTDTCSLEYAITQIQMGGE